MECQDQMILLYRTGMDGSGGCSIFCEGSNLERKDWEVEDADAGERLKSCDFWNWCPCEHCCPCDFSGQYLL